MAWYFKVLKNYVGFTGRARRTEYWMFTLINTIISFILYFLGVFADSVSFLPVLYELAIFLPALAVLIRRLHDTGRSGWWVLISFIPFVGSIIILVFTFLDSQENDNKYGQNPKYSSDY
ncbi:DUF805 domain-containing protein [Psychrobacillus glaciei]|uniref:DUF805 domain-containing protein n=1 Tax=Psychrobacillus glaciei TaxID=2283160 RepID=A0A5J6SNU8_9BACI|nr:DUF805 domain-containing protein [Psychrobacillus glaciei]QFF98434.1 DUF805 domain-containing protein [Psychrobacillus glaciei]